MYAVSILRSVVFLDAVCYRGVLGFVAVICMLRWLKLWSWSSSKKFLKIQLLPQREHNIPSLQKSIG
jgi:hypothetical protein